MRDLNLPGGVDEARFERRLAALEAVNDHFAKRTKADNVGAMDTFYERAFGLISSPKAREAFNIEAETAELRDATAATRPGSGC